MPTLQVPSYFHKVYTATQPIIVLYGGRNSGKSVGISDFACYEMHRRRCDTLVLREYLGSIKESAHKVMLGSINDRLKLKGWKTQENKLISPKGSYTDYKGANRDPGAMKSAEDFQLSWFEETQAAKEESIDVLLPTVLRRKGARCIFSMNPQSEADPASVRLINPFKKEVNKYGFYQDDMHLIIKANWRDNPWFDEVANKLRLIDKENMSTAKYEWIWEGEFYDEVENGIISADDFNMCVDAHIKLGFKATGAIVASHDPSDVGDARGFALRHGPIILNAAGNDKLNINDACDWAMSKARAARCDFFVYDADGCGLSLRRQITDYFADSKVTIREFKGGSTCEHPDLIFDPRESKNHDYVFSESRQVTNKDAFYNLRAHCYFKIADRIRKTVEVINKKAYYNADELISFSSECESLHQLKTELCRLPQKHNSHGKFQLEDKRNMWQKYQIPSPNLADCVMMTMLDIQQPKRHKTIRPSVGSFA
jgi:phage terminase large subunit